MSNYLEQAKRRWPNAKIIGGGRYACVEGGVHWTQQRVWLDDSFEVAKRAQLGCERSSVVDLDFDAAAARERINAQAEREDRRQQRKLADLAAIGFAK